MNNHDWDEDEFPLAFLITFRTYGTWLHGDQRYAVDRHGKNIYGAEKVLPSRNLVKKMTDNRTAAEFRLNGRQRKVVERAIRSVCELRGYKLIAINVRTNHVHVVVAANANPEKMINAFKANCTRELRSDAVVSGSQQVWARGGSRRYLWKPNHVEGAVNYVVHGQGDDLPNF
jgi:REP element-mobilizing transposase RayT